MANRIHAKGPFVQEEYVAAEADIQPGMLVKLNSSGQLIKHDVENGRAEVMFAQEDVLQGRNVDQLYALNAVATVILPNLASEVQGRLENDQVVAIGDWLVSRGNGLLKNLGSLDSGDIDVFTVGVAMEAKDLTDSATTNELIRLRCAKH